MTNLPNTSGFMTTEIAHESASVAAFKKRKALNVLDGILLEMAHFDAIRYRWAEELVEGYDRVYQNVVAQLAPKRFSPASRATRLDLGIATPYTPASFSPIPSPSPTSSPDYNFGSISPVPRFPSHSPSYIHTAPQSPSLSPTLASPSSPTYYAGMLTPASPSSPSYYTISPYSPQMVADRSPTSPIYTPFQSTSKSPEYIIRPGHPNYNIPSPQSPKFTTSLPDDGVDRQRQI